MTSYSENNHSGWKSKIYDDLQRPKRRAPSTREQRRAAYGRLQKVLNEDEVPVLRSTRGWITTWCRTACGICADAGPQLAVKGVSFK